MTTPDPSREAFDSHVLTENGIVVRGLRWINRDELGAYKHPDIQARWLTWQAAMAHKGAPTASDSNAPLEFAIKSAPSDPAGAESSLGNADDASNTAIANACEPCGGWQPIETAPKDGTKFLAYRPLAHLTHDPQIRVVKGTPLNYGCWEATVPSGYSLENFTDGACRATHWQPLPAAPKQEGST